jgi:hypothetical protein
VRKREHPFCSTHAPTAGNWRWDRGGSSGIDLFFFSGKGEERLHWLVYCNRAVNVGGGEHGERESVGCLIYPAKNIKTRCRRESASHGSATQPLPVPVFRAENVPSIDLSHSRIGGCLSSAILRMWLGWPGLAGTDTLARSGKCFPVPCRAVPHPNRGVRVEA